MSSPVWTAAGCAAGAFSSPAELQVDWLPSGMPATAAAVLSAAGLPVEALDERDWWWRTTLPADLPPGSFLVSDGIATLAEIWVDAELVHHVGGMFEGFVLPVHASANVSIRVRSLSTALAEKRPRPRWKARLVVEQRLRWFRTSLTGRMPGHLVGHPPVGPWRGVWLLRGDTPSVVSPGVSTALLPDGRGVVTVDARLAGIAGEAVGWLVVGEARTPASVSIDTLGLATVTGSLTVESPPLWWPHTHGMPALLPVGLEVDGVVVALAETGFRRVSAETADGGFALDINDCRVFARGSCWSPLDGAGAHLSLEAATESLGKMVAAGLNMVRFTGTTAWAAPQLLAVCDRLGIMVWQDVPLAAMDQPDSPAFAAQLRAEVSEALAAAAASPSLVVVCGGAEIEQQAAMVGLALDAAPLSRALAQLVPSTLVYVTNSPTGGVPAFRVDTGVAQYFGVGAYRRPLTDIRRSGVRFAAECFAFAVPPHDVSARTLTPVEWAAGIPRDRGADWDFAEVSRHYAREFFREFPDAAPEFLHDLDSVAAADCLTALWAEWRRPGSGCAGALTISLHDVVPGPGWGLLDAAGRPKSTWFAARRASAPVALLHTDEGLNGLALHAINDGPGPFSGTLTLTLHAGDRVVEAGSMTVAVPARGALTVGDVEILGVFRDVTQAYGFGPASFEVAAAILLDDAGHEVGRTVYVPPGQSLRPAAGLSAALVERDGAFTVVVKTASHARAVVVTLDSGTVDDVWFDLLPGETRELGVTSTVPPERVAVRALNAPIVPGEGG